MKDLVWRSVSSGLKDCAVKATHTHKEISKAGAHLVLIETDKQTVLQIQSNSKSFTLTYT